MAMDTEESLKEYLRLQLRVPLLARLGPLASTFDFIATAAPGVKEILTVGKLTYEVRERNYDLVVVDASATGHVVGQLGSPVAINDLVRVGLVRNQTDWMIDILTDPAQTGVVVVTLPEEMPVSETLELLDRLDAETDIDVAVGRREPGAARAVRPGRGGDLRRGSTNPMCSQRSRPRPGPVSAPCCGERSWRCSLRRSRVPHLTRLREGLPDGPAAGVPAVPVHTAPTACAPPRQIADALGEELSD